MSFHKMLWHWEVTILAKYKRCFINNNLWEQRALPDIILISIMLVDIGSNELTSNFMIIHDVLKAMIVTKTISAEKWIVRPFPGLKFKFLN